MGTDQTSILKKLALANSLGEVMLYTRMLKIKYSQTLANAKSAELFPHADRILAGDCTF